MDRACVGAGDILSPYFSSNHLVVRHLGESFAAHVNGTPEEHEETSHQQRLRIDYVKLLDYRGNCKKQGEGEVTLRGVQPGLDFRNNEHMNAAATPARVRWGRGGEREVVLNS